MGKRTERAPREEAIVKETPSNMRTPFSFDDYRSPGQSSDSSGTLSRFQQLARARAVSDPSENSGQFVQPKPQFTSFDQAPANSTPQTHMPRRRDLKKMRFSFILADSDPPKRSSRLSLAAMDTSNPLPLSETLTPSEQAAEKKDRLVATNSITLRRSAKKSIPGACSRPTQCIKFGLDVVQPDEAHQETPRPPRSSKLRTSEYFDAVEEQFNIKHMAPVHEADGLEEDKDDDVSTKHEQLHMQARFDKVWKFETEWGECYPDVEYWDEDDGDEEERPEGPNGYGSNQEDEVSDEEDIDSDETMEGDLVMRDITSSFTTVTSKTRARCTIATPADTLRLKTAALALCRYTESEEIYANLYNRLSRMLEYDILLAAQENRRPVSVTELAGKLKKFLTKWAVERAECGDSVRFVRHELEWADWIEVAAKTGVLHIKGRGCSCKREWTKQV